MRVTERTVYGIFGGVTVQNRIRKEVVFDGALSQLDVAARTLLRGCDGNEAGTYPQDIFGVRRTPIRIKLGFGIDVNCKYVDNFFDCQWLHAKH